MDFKQWQQKSREINDIVDKTDAILVELCLPHLQSNGSINDSIRLSKEYREAKSNFDKAFKALRQFNKDSSKKYIKEETRLRRANRKVI